MSCNPEVLEFMEQCEAALKVTPVPKLPNDIIMNIIKLAWGTTLDYHRRPIPKEHMDMVHNGLHSDLVCCEEYHKHDQEDMGFYGSSYFEEDMEDEDEGFLEWVYRSTVSVHSNYEDGELEEEDWKWALSNTRKIMQRVRR
jgi:hypothetical protein